MYAVYSKSVTATFNYYDGSKSASTTASADRYYLADTTKINAINQDYAIPDAAKANRGVYKYRGVATASDANATVVTSPTTANTTFYSSYTYTVTIKFDGNGATSGTAPQDKSGTAYMNYAGSKIGISVTMPANPFTRIGYTAGNWNSNKTGTGTTYVVGTPYTFTADATL